MLLYSALYKYNVSKSLLFSYQSKKKSYDGSETLKMIGNDCKIMEENIDTFLFTFLKPGEVWESESCLKLRQVLDLYKRFKDLAW